MKHLFFVFLLISRFANGYTPPFDVLLVEMSKRCIKDRALFNGILSDEEGATFLSLALRNEGLFASTKSASPKESEKSITLGINSLLLNCDKNLVENLKAYLKQRGVNTEKVTHALLDYEPIFIIGSDTKNPQDPQIWIDKATFLPVREIGKEEEISFEKWTAVSALGNKKFPSIVTIKRKDKEQSLSLSEIERQ